MENVPFLNLFIAFTNNRKNISANIDLLLDIFIAFLSKTIYELMSHQQQITACSGAEKKINSCNLHKNVTL